MRGRTPDRARRARLLAVALSLAAFACTGIPSPAQRRGFADSLAQREGWHAITIRAGPLDLVAYVPDRSANGRSLTVFVEGDGLAWIGDVGPSSDPTPREPVGLRMALLHPEGNAAYLARPCQYIGARASGCPQRYWTDGRFSPEVIDATGRAIDALEERFGADRLTLVGYSGGGAVAALVAARRGDVERLVTIAGNVDPAAWARLHRIPALGGSMSPADEVAALHGIPQWHFAGARDSNVPPELALGFAGRFPENERPIVEVEAAFDHHCCWASAWPRLCSEVLARRAP
jgi:pimeloyl-ACP methyl ester carboxylesterase